MMIKKVVRWLFLVPLFPVIAIYAFLATISWAFDDGDKTWIEVWEEMF